MVVLYNHSNVDYHVEKGAKIAQLICELVIQPTISVISSDSDATDSQSTKTDAPPPQLNTKRGAGGFGSTGY